MSLFEINERPLLRPRFNIAPSEEIAVVRPAPDGSRRLEMMRWGLIPYWSREPATAARTINARSETADWKPAFRNAFRFRRCLIPADGFFEWKKQKGGSLPFYYRMRDESIFAFAGLWDLWRNGKGESIRSCTILTTSPNELVAPVHNRMPVILAPDHYRAWLDPQPARPQLKGLLLPFPAAEMIAFPVGRRVNSPRNDDPACLTPDRSAAVD